MDELNKLFAIQLMIHDLRFSDSHKKPLLDAVSEMITNEISECSGNYKQNLLSIKVLIDNIHS